LILSIHNIKFTGGFDRHESMISTAHLLHEASLILFEEKRIGVSDSVMILSPAWLATMVSQIFSFKVYDIRLNNITFFLSFFSH
jgi:hypothetical protein